MKKRFAAFAGTVRRIVRLPLLFPMGVAELFVFFVCISLAIFKPRSVLLNRLLDWIHGLPDFGWYIGKQSNVSCEARRDSDVALHVNVRQEVDHG